MQLQGQAEFIESSAGEFEGFKYDNVMLKVNDMYYPIQVKNAGCNVSSYSEGDVVNVTLQLSSDKRHKPVIQLKEISLA